MTESTSPNQHPGLLVVTEFPPNSPGGGPTVLRQMLKEWPAQRLFWWSCLPERSAHLGQKTAAHRVARIPARLYPNHRLARQRAWLLESLWAPYAARSLQRTIQRHRPDLLWVIPHAWAIPPLSRTLAVKGVPFHITVQDYMDTRGAITRLGEARSHRFVKLTEELYARAVTRDATSHPMIANLRTRTGCEAVQMLHAGLEESDFAWLARPPRRCGDTIRIAYAGTIVVEKEFEWFVHTLARVRERVPSPVTLEFFSSHSYGRRGWFDSTWMREHGTLPETALNDALRECAWGFAPMSLSDDDARYNRFSFPTKFISYLAAGLPVITLGHPESSVVKMATAYDVGLCVTTPEAEQLSARLLAALSRPDAAAVHRQAILDCATREFDARRMRSVLYECFRQCSKQAALG